MFGVTNMAGVWAVLGQLLFVVWSTALIVFVFLPLWSRLRGPLRAGRNRLLFHVTWGVGFGAGLVITNTIQRSPASSGSGVLLGSSTVYTPFGPWPSTTFVVPPLGLAGAVNLVVVATIGSLAVLSAALLLLAREARPTACASNSPAAPRPRTAAASFLLWAPLGLLTSCANCTPLYLGAVGLVAPSVAAIGYSFLPFAPWGGFAGLVYLGSLSFALVMLRRATAPPAGVESIPTATEAAA